jgi:hypothetical protein
VVATTTATVMYLSSYPALQALPDLLLFQHFIPQHHLRLRSLQQTSRHLLEEHVRQRRESQRLLTLIHQIMHQYFIRRDRLDRKEASWCRSKDQEEFDRHLDQSYFHWG